MLFYFLSLSVISQMLSFWRRAPNKLLRLIGSSLQLTIPFFWLHFLFAVSFWHISLTVSSNVLPSSLANIPLTPETARDQERRIRREIANSNERRRMQSINAGFQSLKTLIPHSDGEKLSKVGLWKFLSDELKWASSCFYGQLFLT